MKQLLAVLWLALIALAQPVAAAEPAFPKLTGRVVDEAHLLSPSQVVDLTSKSEALEAQSGRQFVVVTVPSLQGLTIEDYANRLFRTWKLGDAKRNDGVMLIVAPNEHKVRIENGYGSTVFVTDAMSGIILRQSVLPRFKQQPPDYGGGITAGADQIIKLMSLPPEEAARRIDEAEKQQRTGGSGEGDFFPYVFLAIFIFLFFIRPLLFRRRGGRVFRRGPVVIWGPGFGGGFGGGGGSWGGGGFGGGGFGGFSGGGGSSGGGGASGSW